MVLLLYSKKNKTRQEFWAKRGGLAAKGWLPACCTFHTRVASMLLPLARKDNQSNPKFPLKTRLVSIVWRILPRTPPSFSKMHALPKGNPSRVV